MARPDIYLDLEYPGSELPIGTKAELKLRARGSLGFSSAGPAVISSEPEKVLRGTRVTWENVRPNEGASGEQITDPEESCYELTLTAPGSPPTSFLLIVPDEAGSLDIRGLKIDNADPLPAVGALIKEWLIAEGFQQGEQGIQGPAGGEGAPLVRTLDPVDEIAAGDGPFGTLLAVNPSQTVLVLPADADATIPVGRSHEIQIPSTGGLVVHAGPGASIVGGWILGYAEAGGLVTATKSASNTWAVTGVTWPYVYASDGFSTAGSLIDATLDAEFGGETGLQWHVEGVFPAVWSSDGDVATPVNSPGVRRHVSVLTPWAHAIVARVTTVTRPSANRYALMIHGSSLASLDYYAIGQAGASGGQQLSKRVAGVNTFLGTGPDGGNGAVISVALTLAYDAAGVEVGHYIIGAVGGVVFTAVVDADVADPVRAGLDAVDLLPDGEWDDFIVEVV